MKSRLEIMFGWWLVLTVGGWCADLFTHVPLAVQWIHATWRVIGFDSARGIGPGTVLLTIIRSLPALFFLTPLAGALIVGIVAWFIGPGDGGDPGIKRGSQVTDARTLARLTRRRK